MSVKSWDSSPVLLTLQPRLGQIMLQRPGEFLHVRFIKDALSTSGDCLNFEIGSNEITPEGPGITEAVVASPEIDYFSSIRTWCVSVGGSPNDLLDVESSQPGRQ